MSGFRVRYFIIRYPAASEKKFADLDKDGRFIGTIPVHEWLAEYHWSRISEDFVLLLGEYSYQWQQALLDHVDVEMLPSVSSLRKLGTFLKKPGFWAALKTNLGVDDNATMDDILDRIEEKHGPIFGPIR
jgi:hypothetical protein